MGIHHLFDGQLNLKRLSETTKFEFDSIMHTAKMKIDENGIRIAAAVFTDTRASSERFICNRAFVFAVRDRNGKIPFIGAIRDPPPYVELQKEKKKITEQIKGIFTNIPGKITTIIKKQITAISTKVKKTTQFFKRNNP